MKNFILFLIYAVRRDEIDFWTKMSYDDVFPQICNCYDAYIKWKAKLKGYKNDQHSMQLLQLTETEIVRYFLIHAMPENIKI